MRIINFFDGAESETTPTIGNIKASGLIEYPDDATYEASEDGSPAEGNIYFNLTTNLIRYYNGTEWINLVDESSVQQLTNKSLDGDENTFTDIDLPSLKTILADANKFIVRNVLGQIVSLKTVPNGEVVGTTDTQDLTNKTIDADENVILNIENENIKAGAAIDVTKLGDGSVSNTEFQYINSLTSNAQDQLDSKIPLSQKGSINGVAELDAGGKVPASQLPSFVDDVLEYANLAAFPVTGETGKIYVALDTGKTYRWSGSIYVEISASDVNSVNGYTGTVNLELDDLVDLVLTAPVAGQIIEFDGTNWVNVTPASGITDLNGLSDVTITTPVTGQKLQYNGTQWVNVTDDLESLNDVLLTTPTVTDVLTFDGTKWVNSPPSSGNLDALSDVVITTPQTGDLLKFNGTNWVNTDEFEDVYFATYRSGNQTGISTNNSSQKIIYNSILSDTHSGFNTVTGVYTVPVGKGGKWIITASFQCLNTNILAGRQQCYIIVNGSPVVLGHNPVLSAGTSEVLNVTSYPFTLNAGDTVEIHIFSAANNSVSNLTILGSASVTFFGAHRIGN